MSPAPPRHQSADVRLRRLLALVPWVAARHGPRLEEVCERFGCTEAELVDDLQQLFLCGLYPYTPDVLIDVDVAEGRVWIRYADYFSRPLRLTPEEALSLVAAGHALLAVPGSDPEGPLARALAKLAAVVGVDLDEALEVVLGRAPTELMDVLREGVARHHQVELEYYAFGRDEWTRRVVDPYAVFSSGGHWYVTAYCHQVDDERLFRVDRIRRATLLDSEFAAPERPPELTVYQAQPDDPRVVLDLEPSAHWVTEEYPAEAVEPLDHGVLRVTLAVSERAWLERLLLRLGPAARVVVGDPEVAVSAALRLLARYRSQPEGAVHPRPEGPAVPSGRQ